MCKIWAKEIEVPMDGFVFRPREIQPFVLPLMRKCTWLPSSVNAIYMSCVKKVFTLMTFSSKAMENWTIGDRIESKAHIKLAGRIWVFRGRRRWDVGRGSHTDTWSVLNASIKRKELMRVLNSHHTRRTKGKSSIREQRTVVCVREEVDLGGSCGGVLRIKRAGTRSWAVSRSERLKNRSSDPWKTPEERTIAENAQ